MRFSSSKSRSASRDFTTPDVMSRFSSHKLESFRMSEYFLLCANVMSEPSFRRSFSCILASCFFSAA